MKLFNILPLGFPWKTKDPFIFCVHHRDEFPAGNENMGPAVPLTGRTIGNDFTIKDGWRMYHGSEVPGFPYHPHRGFETVTITKEGWIDHTDSMGASGRFGEGDVQWMTAGRGVLHSEMFPLLNKEQGNTTELFQLWLNLPKRSKFVEPHFKMLWQKDIPSIQLKDTNGKITQIDVIAGTFQNHQALDPTPDSWASDKNNQVGIYTVQIEAEGSFELPVRNEGVDCMLYFYEGNGLKVNDTEIPSYHAVELLTTDGLQIQAGKETCKLLVLQGKPINEPVVQYGPFVMNTEQEIHEAFAEYRQTQFGGWPWPKAEYVHPREQGRFAKHADGKIE
jgi:redox-sensitive bicupin YhaK (pirin superfamily)